MEKIDIEEIMEQIRSDIADRGLKDDGLLFEGVPILGGGTGGYSRDAYEEVMREIQERSNVESYRPLLGNPIEKLVKKVIRRLVAFYIESIVDDQNIFNKNVYTSIAMNHKKTIQDDERMLELERKLCQCEKRIVYLEQKLKETED